MNLWNAVDCVQVRSPILVCTHTSVHVLQETPAVQWINVRNLQVTHQEMIGQCDAATCHPVGVD